MPESSSLHNIHFYKLLNTFFNLVDFLHFYTSVKLTRNLLRFLKGINIRNMPLHLISIELNKPSTAVLCCHHNYRVRLKTFKRSLYRETMHYRASSASSTMHWNTSTLTASGFNMCKLDCDDRRADTQFSPATGAFTVQNRVKSCTNLPICLSSSLTNVPLHNSKMVVSNY